MQDLSAQVVVVTHLKIRRQVHALISQAVFAYQFYNLASGKVRLQRQPEIGPPAWSNRPCRIARHNFVSNFAGSMLCLFFQAMRGGKPPRVLPIADRPEDLIQHATA